MNMKMLGKAMVLEDNIDTDQIYAGRYLDLVDPKEIGRHCFGGNSFNLVESFSESKIIIAGVNFGCGSSREHAVIALLNMGVKAIISESFARIFFRNATNLGLPLLVCEGINKCVIDGQLIEVDIRNAAISLLDTAEIIKCNKMDEHTINILEHGGIKAIFKNRTGVGLIKTLKGNEK